MPIAAQGTAAIAREILRDLQQPGPDRASWVKAVQVVVGTDECILRDIVCVVGVAHNQIRQPEYCFLLLLHDLLVGGDVACLGTHDQVGCQIRIHVPAFQVR